MIINPHRFATTTPATAFEGFGNASRSFDGTDNYIRLPDSADFSFTDGAGNDQPFSISLWCKPTSAIGAGQVLVFKYYAPDAQQEWGLQFIATGAIQLACFTTGGKFVAGRSTSTYTQNEWMHVVATYDGSETTGGFTIYVDGTDDTGTPASSLPYTGMTAGTEDVFIGAFRSAATTYAAEFTGNMADFRIYDTELSASDVSELYAGTDIQTNLVGHWLKDTPSLLDHAGNNDANNYGSKFSFDHPSPAVKFGNVSRSFDGSDYVAMGDVLDSVTSGTGAKFTISAWIKTTTLEDTDFFSKYQVGSNQRSFLCRVLSDGNLAMLMSGDGNFAANRWGRQTDTAPISADTWHHVSITYDQTATGDYLRMWVDGVEDTTLIDWLSNGTFTSIYDGNADLQISGVSGANTQWGGNIVDVRIYDTDLTASDISDLYAGTHVTTNLVGHWLTNNDDVKDYAGTNDGTNYGSTYSYDNPNAEVEYGQASRVFNGTSHYIEIDDSDNLSFGDGSNDSPFSISAWVEVDTNDKFRVISKSSTNNNEYFFGTFGSGVLAFIFGDGDLFHGITTTSSMPENEWIHISCTYDGSGGLNFRDGMNIYINGVASTYTDHGGNYTAMNNTTNPLLIGKYANNNTFADGNIADVRIYDTELSATEVYELAKGVDHRTNLIGQWLTNSVDVEDKAGTNDGTNYGSTYSTNSPL